MTLVDGLTLTLVDGLTLTVVDRFGWTDSYSC